MNQHGTNPAPDLIGFIRGPDPPRWSRSSSDCPGTPPSLQKLQDGVGGEPCVLSRSGPDQCPQGEDAFVGLEEIHIVPCFVPTGQHQELVDGKVHVVEPKSPGLRQGTISLEGLPHTVLRIVEEVQILIVTASSWEPNEEQCHRRDSCPRSDSPKGGAEALPGKRSAAQRLPGEPRLPISMLHQLAGYPLHIVQAGPGPGSSYATKLRPRRTSRGRLLLSAADARTPRPGTRGRRAPPPPPRSDSRQWRCRGG